MSCREFSLSPIIAAHFYARGTVIAELECAITVRAKGGAVNVLTRLFTTGGRRGAGPLRRLPAR